MAFNLITIAVFSILLKICQLVNCTYKSEKRQVQAFLHAYVTHNYITRVFYGNKNVFIFMRPPDLVVENSHVVVWKLLCLDW